MSVLATIEPANLQVDAGAEASLVVRVRNRGSIVDQFDIAVVGPTSPWASVDPPSLRLFPDKEGEARITFRPPRAPDPAADTYPFGIAVRAASDASASAVEEGRIVVAPFVQLASEIVPQTSRGSRSAAHDLTIQNVGNSVAEVSIKASDPDRLLSFEVLPERAGLRPGGSTTIRARVRPKTTFWLGSPKRVPFAVQIDEPSAGSYQIPGDARTARDHPRLGEAGKRSPRRGHRRRHGPAPHAGFRHRKGHRLAGGGRQCGAHAHPGADHGASGHGGSAAHRGPDADAEARPAGHARRRRRHWRLRDVDDEFVCPPKDSCRDIVKSRLITILAGLQGKASGTRLVSFTQTPSGTLPVLATWKDWHYPYSAADGSKGDLDQVSIDLAPLFVGAPAYALVHDVSGAQFTFVVAAADANALFGDLYNAAILTPTPPPDAGGGSVFLGDIYLRPIGDLGFLQDITFVNPNP